MGNPGPQGGKGYQVRVASKSLFLKISSLLICSVCVCDALQGAKGALGDPGLPGPTGIRGEYGERVRLTPRVYVCVMSKQCQSSFMFFLQYDKKMSSTKMDCSKVKA